MVNGIDMEQGIRLLIIITVLAVFAVPLAQWLARRGATLNALFWGLVLLPLLIPVEALALQFSVSHLPLPAPWSSLLLPAYSSLAFLMVPTWLVARHLDPSLDETARVLGANRMTTWRKLKLPLLRPAIISGYLLAFTHLLWLHLIYNVLNPATGLLYAGSAVSLLLLLITLALMARRRGRHG